MSTSRRRVPSRTLAGLLAVLVAAGAQALVPPAAEAQAPPAPRAVPPLASEVLPPAIPEVSAGDFRNRPDASPERPLPAPKASFDPGRSTPLDEETTPTRRTWRNPDGSLTAEVSARPVRYRDAAGAWKDIDLGVAAAPDGALEAKAAPGAARLGATAAGELATVSTGAGTVALRHPQAQPVAATVSAGTATYAKALPGGRDVVIELTPEGFKETVVLPDAAAGPTYSEQFSLPAGTTARQGPGGVDFVDGSGSVFATYGGGVATDAAFARTGPLGATDVAVRLVSVAAGVATVEVGVDPAWLAASGRAFPVRIDPSWRTDPTAVAFDSFVSNPDSYSSSPSTHPWLVAGNDGSTLLRSLLRFNLSGFPSPGPRVVVSEAHVRVLNWYTYGYSCTPGTVSLFGLGSAFDATTRWADQPTLSPTAPVSSKSFAHNNNAGSACPQAVESLDATALARAWLNGSAPNHGLSLRAGTDATTETQTANFKAFYSAEGTPAGWQPPTLSITYNQLPPVATPSAPADGITLSTPTPTLTANPVTDPDASFDPTQTVQYWFRVGTGPNVEGGHDIDSGWLTTPSWPIPAGALRDGTYRWHVFTWDGVAEGYFTPPGPTDQRSFRSALRLGAADPAPTDAYGPVQVNLATGNLALSHTGPSLPTVGGELGLSLTYNSQAQSSGIIGSYYADPGTHTFPTDAVFVRNDPSIAFSWGADNAPGPGLGTDNYLVRWEGKVSVPVTGTYRFYVGTTDGIRVFVNNIKVLERWADPGGAVNDTISGLTSSLAANTPVPLKVEYMEGGGPAQVALAAYGPLENNPKAHMVHPAWLASDPGPLPFGWTLAPATGVSYAGARAFEHGVTVIDVAGGSHTYYWNGSGYEPPPGEDGLLTKNAAGELILHDADGMTYVFDATGRLRSAVSGTDDRDPAAPRYGWSGTPLRLRTVTDPVSGQVITVSYGGDSACAAPPTGLGFDPAPPAAMLCRAQYSWDNTDTKFFYRAGQLARIDNPGSSNVDLADTDFGYAGGVLTQVRDARVLDAIAAGVAANDDTTKTLITYAAAKAASVTLVAPAQGAARPAHSYEYVSTTETRVRVAGLSEPNGYGRKVTSDDGGRMVTDTDATARATTYAWDGADRLLATTDAAQRRTTTHYDVEGRPTDTYGPAPASCFGANRLPTGSCAPMGRTTTAYDGSITGLAGRYWDNPDWAGPPKLHRTGAVSGASPDPVLGSSWSARLSGEVDLGADANLRVSGSGTMTLWVDDRRVTATDVIAAGRHRVQIDLRAGASPTLEWRAPGGTFAAVPGDWLNPRYGLVTRTTVHDSPAASPSLVTDAAYARAETGLATSVTQDPAGLALTTATAYEEPGAGTFFRRTSRTLPAGNATAYASYGRNEARDNPCTTTVDPANQGGRPKTTSAPDPDGAGSQASRVTEAVYDAAGRPVASRVGTEAWTCATYDVGGRPLTRTIPAFGGQPARTVTYNWAVGNNPLKTSVADPAGTITTTVDLLGRTVTYTDAAGTTTNSTYDQPGRLVSTTGPGLLQSTNTAYDAAGRPTEQKVDGVVVATPAYNAAGELASVNYGNGTRLSAVGRDQAGRTTALTWVNPSNQNIATDAVTRSQSGRVLTNTIDGGTANTFTYDPAGRLITAGVGGRSLTYCFGDAPRCPEVASGRNTNRTSVTDNGNTTTYTYDAADRLVSSSDAAVGTPAYDPHGNTTTLGTQTLVYDGVDRHVATTDGPTSVTYVRDATDRIVERKVGGNIIARYGYAGPADSPAFVNHGLLLAGQQRTFPLMGGVLYAKSGPNGDRWSYPNIHGDVMAVADANGAKVGATATYDPFGNSLTALPDNEAGNFDYGWLGQHQRPLEHEGSLATIEMGARPYVPSLGRFLEVDPVEGGSANDYDYGNADPLNQYDVSGEGPCPPFLHRTRPDGSHYCQGSVRNVAKALRLVWDATGGKVFTCDDNGVTEFIENLGLVPSVDGTEADKKEAAARYTASQSAGAILTGLNVLIRSGQLRASTALAARVATASNVGLGVTAVATTYQIGRFFAC